MESGFDEGEPARETEAAVSSGCSIQYINR